jgi:hypothetical protein
VADVIQYNIPGRGPLVGTIPPEGYEHGDGNFYRAGEESRLQAILDANWSGVEARLDAQHAALVASWNDGHRGVDGGFDYAGVHASYESAVRASGALDESGFGYLNGGQEAAAWGAVMSAFERDDTVTIHSLPHHEPVYDAAIVQPGQELGPGRFTVEMSQVEIAAALDIEAQQLARRSAKAELAGLVMQGNLAAPSARTNKVMVLLGLGLGLMWMVSR